MGRVFFKTNYMIENVNDIDLERLKKRSERSERELYVGKIANVEIKSISDFNGQTILNGFVYNDNHDRLAYCTCYYNSLSDDFKEFINNGLIHEGDTMKLYITKITRKERGNLQSWLQGYGY